MAKRDDDSKKGKKEVETKKPSLVDKVPEGFTAHHLDEDGNQVYRKSTETPKSKNPVDSKPIKKIPAPKSNGTTKPPIKPKPTKTPPSDDFDEVILPKKKVEQKASQIGVVGGVDNFFQRQFQKESNPFVQVYDYSDASGNYTNNARTVYLDSKTGKPIDNNKSWDDKGNYAPSYTGQTMDDVRTNSVQQYQTPVIIKDGSALQTRPAVIDKPINMAGTQVNHNISGGGGTNATIYNKTSDKSFYAPKYDANGNKISDGVMLSPEKYTTASDPRIPVPIIPVGEYQKYPLTKDKPEYITSNKFKKGGSVKPGKMKVKGYYDGGAVNDNYPNNPYAQNNTFIQDDGRPVISGQGVIQMGDTQPTNTGNSKGASSGYNTSDKKQKKEKTPDQIKRDANARATANAGGAVLGAYGSSYYNSQVPTSEGDAARNAGMAAVSNSGAIGGVIGGVAAIGDKIGKPVKASSEKLDSSGNLIDPDRARKNAIGGSLFSPSKALVARGSYKGGYTDVSGKGYTKSLEDKAKAQLSIVNEENQASKHKQALALRDAGEFTEKPKDIYDFNSISFDENQKLSIDKTGYYGYKDGGKIVGKGTGKSDSIKAKVESDSFIVPKENAKLAEELRMKLLKAPNIKKANLNQKGGEHVKLSNGEHLFTPEEKEELLEKGINVDLLAPNSDDEKKENKDMFQFPDILGYKGGGPVKGTGYNGSTWNGKEWINPNGTLTKEKQSQLTSAYLLQVKKENSRSADVIEQHNEKIKSDRSRTAEYNRNLSRINELRDQSELIDKTNTKPPAGTKIKAPKIKAPTSKATKQPKVSDNIPSKDITVPVSVSEPDINSDKLVIKDVPINSLNNTGIPEKGNPKTKKTLVDYLGNADPTMFAGIGQTALGLNMLKDSKRPVDKFNIDPYYNQNVNRSITDAGYGFTPENKFLLNQQADNALSDARYSARNFAGGDSGTAFNQEMRAINNGWANKIGLRAADQDLRMQKQKYMDQQVAGRADLLDSTRRRSYGDAMDAFQQKQQAGSELISAGLSNSIGAYRFNQDKRAREEADRQRGYSMDNYYGNKT